MVVGSVGRSGASLPSVGRGAPALPNRSSVCLLCMSACVGEGMGTKVGTGTAVPTLVRDGASRSRLVG